MSRSDPTVDGAANEQHYHSGVARGSPAAEVGGIDEHLRTESDKATAQQQQGPAKQDSEPTTEQSSQPTSEQDSPLDVDVSTPPGEAFVATDELPDSIEPTIQTIQAGAATITGLVDGIEVTGLETDSDLAVDPFDPYHEDDPEFTVVFERDGNHTLDIELQASDEAAVAVDRYDPAVYDIGVRVEDEAGHVATANETLGVRDGRPTIGTYADADEDYRIALDGVRAAITDWSEGTIDTALLQDVIDAWASGDPIAFVNAADQEGDGTELTVQAGTYLGTEWGAHVHFFVDDEMGSTIGVTEEFEAGSVQEEFTIDFDRLDEPVDQDQSFMVMLHITDEDGGYADNDATWVWADGDPITDIAFLEVE